MRLDFKILWFEDQFRELRSQLEEITDHIQEAGFQAEIIEKRDVFPVGDREARSHHRGRLLLAVDQNFSLKSTKTAIRTVNPAIKPVAELALRVANLDASNPIFC